MFLPLHDRNPMRHISIAYVNYTLIALTCLAFLLQMAATPQTQELLVISLGMIPIVVRDLVPQPLLFIPDEVTFLSYAFLHADWMHLLTNMLFLWIFGDNVEDAMGHLRYLLFYLACAAAAALAHMAMNIDGNGPLIGASGAVAGVMGAYALLYPHARVFVLAKLIILIPLPIPAFWMLGFWIGTQFFYALVGSTEPVAWWAHIGGAAAGLLLATTLRRRGVVLLGGR